MPRLETPESKAQLHRLLKRGDSGVIITTVNKFAEAGHLNDRSNIIVLVDEAHRSQEGSFGKAWRAAVPNARFFGATGTAIEDKSRSTFKLFGDPEDPGFVMSRYTPEQSIADGFTKPVVVEPRPVEFNLRKDELDEAFDELAEAEKLDEDAKEFLAGKASHAETILANPDRSPRSAATSSGTTWPTWSRSARRPRSSRTTRLSSSPTPKRSRTS